MPLTGIDSFPPTMSAFEAHWAQVNTALGGGGLVLTDGFTLANLTSGRTALMGLMSDKEAATNTRQIGADARNMAKTTCAQRLAEFIAKTKWAVSRGPYKSSIPKKPPFKSDESDFLRPMNDMLTLWAAINADSTIPGFTPPLLLLGGYTLANATTDVNAATTAFSNHKHAVANEKIAIDKRDAPTASIRAHLVEYRKAVLATFGKGHYLVTSLPSITPAPGSTPAAVVLSGSWDSVGVQGSLSCTAPTGPNLDHLTLKYSPVPYRESTASVVDNFPITQLTFLTTFGLIHAGAVADYKIYVVTTTGNQKGSNTVRITRPL